MSTTLYAEIVKAERNADGDLVVVGKATGPDLDLDKQVCDPTWLGKAMPEWFSTGGNIREQHSSVAAGVATELEQAGESWMVSGIVVDPVSALKVEKKVLTGFSIGIKDPRVVKDAAAPGGRVVGGQIVEVSLVDRPCNPTCTLTLAKAAGPDVAALVKVEELTEVADDEVTIKVGGSVFSPADLAKLVAVKKSIEAEPATASVDNQGESGGADVAAEPAVDAAALSEGGVIAPVDIPADAEASGSDPGAMQSGEYIVGRDQVAALVAEYGFTAEQAERVPVWVRPIVLSGKSATVDKGAMAPLKPGGKPRYPIENVQDLKDAIRAAGRGKPADIDEIHAHIKAEAKRLKQTGLIPDDWKAAVADLAKADSALSHDASAIAAVRDGLVALIHAELQELCDGQPELYDVEQLLCSLRMLMSWWSDEAAEGEVVAPYSPPVGTTTVIELAADADTTVSTPTVTKTSEPDVPVSDEPDRLAELVKSAVAKQTEASDERIRVLEDQLQKALALPEPGGPVLTRTPAQATQARQTDAVLLKKQADVLYRQADEVQGTDPRLAQGYRERAALLVKQAS